MAGSPSENMMKLASKRADELGVEVRFVHMTGRPSKLVVTNPDEPPPLDKFEISVDEAGGWWRACEQAGLIELKAGMKFEDFEETLACGLKLSELEAFCKDTPKRHMVLREVDNQEYFLIEQAEVRFQHTGNPVLWHKSRMFNARSESVGMMKQRSTPLDQVADVQQVEASVCQCGQPLYMAPTERTVTCPACGATVANAGFVGQGRNAERRDVVSSVSRAALKNATFTATPSDTPFGTVKGADGQPFTYLDFNLGDSE